MASKKLRFLVRSEGKLRQLFSLSQTANGDVQFFRNGEITQARGHEKWQDMKELNSHRISVHQSLGSQRDGITVLHTTKYKHGDVVKEAAFVKKNKSKLCWPIISVLNPKPDTSNYDLKTRGGDKRALLIDLDVSNDTIIYHVVAVSKHSKALDLDFCKVLDVRMKSFDVHIYVTFLNRLPTFVGTHAHLQTSKPQRNGVSEEDGYFEVPKNWEEGAESMTPSELSSYLSTYSDELAGQAMLSNLARIDNDMELEFYYKNHQPYFSKSPNSYYDGIYEIGKLDRSYKPGSSRS